MCPTIKIFNPRLPKGGWLPLPLKIIFRHAKTLNFTIKWVQLTVGSSFPVIRFTTLPWGRGKVTCQS